MISDTNLGTFKGRFHLSNPSLLKINAHITTHLVLVGLLSDSDVVEVRRGLETLKTSWIAKGDGKNEYLKTVTFVNVHSNCRKNYTNNLSITAFKRCQEEPSTSVSPQVSTLAFENTVLKAADALDDKYGRSVMERINFVYDLVSVEAKYHGKCFSNFVLVRGKDDAGRPLDKNIKIAMENPARYQCRFFTSPLQCRNKGVYKNSAWFEFLRRLVFKMSKIPGLQVINNTFNFYKTSYMQV
ncbi:hypothetical protein PV328_007830 [Microctonus aethiopoides]|uniref:Uncharacterized protein n=1 Tax=Microctonus aethiopoides TaxID=144406 RepID=A0AA39C9I3_9HYME|nr:hypothetical protein PV328_007830 [Microctonus aethiopoides]